MLAVVRGGPATAAARLTAHACTRLPRQHPTRGAARRAQARQKARAQGLTNVTFEAGDADTLPLPPGGFDAALCSNGMLYFADVGAALRRIAGWLRPGGRLAFNTPVVRAPRAPARRARIVKRACMQRCCCRRLGLPRIPPLLRRCSGGARMPHQNRTCRGLGFGAEPCCHARAEASTCRPIHHVWSPAGANAGMRCGRAGAPAGDQRAPVRAATRAARPAAGGRGCGAACEPMVGVWPRVRYPSSKLMLPISDFLSCCASGTTCRSWTRVRGRLHAFPAAAS